MGKMTKCQVCKEEIAKNAKVCPKCGAKQKKRKWLFILLVIVLIGAIGAMLGNDDENTSNVTTEEVKNYKVGETFQTKKFEITVTNVSKRYSVGDMFFESTASEGAVYVAVQWKYKNITEDPISSFSTPDIKLVSPKGKEYNPDSMASASFASQVNPNEKILSDLNPGITTTAADVFEVAESLIAEDGWTLKISGNKVDINVK